MRSNRAQGDYVTTLVARVVLEGAQLFVGGGIADSTVSICYRARGPEAEKLRASYSRRAQKR